MPPILLMPLSDISLLKAGSGPRIRLQAWTHCMAMAGMINIIDLVML